MALTISGYTLAHVIRQRIAQMNEEQLDSNVSVYVTDNDNAFATEECQVLDVGHPILRF